MESLTTPLTHFKEQFNFAPVINHKETLPKYARVIVCGMGGSALSVNLLKLFFPELPLSLHNTYGLPTLYDKDSTLIIINSYSGNTEEEIDSFERAKKDNANLACLSLGGELLTLADNATKAFIKLPESSLEPRFSIGHQMIGLLALMGEESKIEVLRNKIELLDLTTAEINGKELAKMFEGKYPVLYASANLFPVAYLIKAAINEGAKVPSFSNCIPEANHNELQSFVTDDTSNYSKDFGLLLLTSPYDHTRILKRFTVMEEMYNSRGFTVSLSKTDHTDILQIFTLIITGYYMATYMAITKGINPYTTPFIAEFKKKLTE